MLWKKESRRSDAHYIDIFQPNTQYWDSKISSLIQNFEQNPHPAKSNAIALEKRNEGNEVFRFSSTIVAMALYNDCLRFAQPGSEHISLAYANRAACFLKMKMYDECLIDIEYAIAAGYPEHLRPKLDDRKDRCLKEMQEDPHYPREQLSIQPNEMFPCLSKIARVQKTNETSGYSVVAMADIDVGQPIIIEDVYHGFVIKSFKMCCNICLKEFRNLLPCDKCAVAMFCPECKGHFLHGYECGLNFCEENESEFNIDVKRLVRSHLSIFKQFSTADELMEFVEDLMKKPNQLPDNLLDDRSKYQAFLSRQPNIENDYSLIEEMLLVIYSTYTTLLRIPYVNDMFATTKHRRFLIHLIGRYGDISLDFLSQQLSANRAYSVTPIMQNYIEHSCCPNTASTIVDGKCVNYAIKSIKKGEKLFISHALSDMKPTSERKKFLWKAYKIDCQCLRCLGRVATPAQREELISDPAFRLICANVESFQSLGINIENAEPLMEACVSILQKYSRMNWCDEIDYVVGLFKYLHKIQLLARGSDFKHPFVCEFLNAHMQQL